MNITRKFSFPDALADCDDYFIAGGAVVSHLMGTEVNDFDVYPKSKEAAKHIVETLWASGVADFIMKTDRAISFLLYEKDANGRRIPLQVMAFDEFDTAEKIFSRFDFPACMVAVDDKGVFYSDPNAIEDLIARRISYNKESMFPLASLIRLEKYKKKGFHVPHSTTTAIGFCVAAKGMPQTWDEAEGLIGGYYGRSFKFVKDNNAPFSLEAVIDCVTQVDHKEVYSVAEMPPSLEEVLYSIDPKPIPHIKLLGQDIEVKEGNILGKSLSFAAHAIGPTLYYPMVKSYKYVVMRNGQLVSQHRSSFKYELGKIAEAPHHPWLYSSKVIDMYRHHNGVLLELYSLPEDIKDYTFGFNHAILQSSRLFVNRIVPEDEVQDIKHKELVQLEAIGPHNLHAYKALIDGQRVLGSTEAGESIATPILAPWAAAS